MASLFICKAFFTTTLESIGNPVSQIASGFVFVLYLCNGVPHHLFSGKFIFVAGMWTKEDHVAGKLAKTRM